MSIRKTTEELQKHKEQALKKITSYLDSLINSEDPHFNGKADKLSYWLEDWTTFLQFENKFNPMSLRRYKRGEIVKAHLGFNVGSEEGGLHYAVVIDKNNPKSSPVMTIVPLTSVKPNTDLSHLPKGNVHLGNEIFTNLNSKISSTIRRLTNEIAFLVEAVGNDMEKSATAVTINEEEFQQRILATKKELDFVKRMQNEISKMRMGSIALTNQITTISKIRIYDPKTDHDILSHVKLSNEKLNLIDAEIINNYINQ